MAAILDFRLANQKKICNDYGDVPCQIWCLYHNLHDSPHKCMSSVPLYMTITCMASGDPTGRYGVALIVTPEVADMIGILYDWDSLKTYRHTL